MYREKRAGILKALVIPAFVLALSACSANKFIGRPNLSSVQQQALPEPTREDLILQQRAYVIGPYDKVSIDVFGATDLSRTVQVDANGQIALPLSGTLNAAGKTPTELAAVIAGALRYRYVRNPSVSVNVDTVNQSYAVDGEVKKAGNYPMTGRMTLLRAIASAEGTGQFADKHYVIVFRQVKGQQFAALYDVDAIHDGQYPDPEIFANDLIHVGESSSARVFSSLIASGALLTAPLVTVLNRSF